MDITEQIKPISFLKANTTEIVKNFDNGQEEPIIITQNGEAKMVVISIKAYQSQLQELRRVNEQMAFMKLMAMSAKEIAEGKVVSEEDFLGSLDKDD
ncbi:type II toxin-antitoxin system Phd/YefM family antitoxin [Pseudoduganella namucuonensis]|uniref:Antitoxin n=1 Tax=Pseudoduganella namucuonensis TaxID=1035707 RepID=A0A1I7LZ84_9BURK|nr:type II toxin-antitoxin system Phd/YefM family antitoxin [Pseudoduganella namucuonensis]SFV15014.1 prevent-host-death family protein [Pseudoduganella namucuonensis]